MAFKSFAFPGVSAGAVMRLLVLALVLKMLPMQKWDNGCGYIRRGIT